MIDVDEKKNFSTPSHCCLLPSVETDKGTFIAVTGAGPETNFSEVNLNTDSNIMFIDDSDDDHSSSSESSEEEESAGDTDFLDTPILPSRPPLRMARRPRGHRDASAAGIGRCLLGRPKNSLVQEHASTFSKSAAGEIKRVTTEPTLSCLSTRSLSMSSRSSSSRRLSLSRCNDSSANEVFSSSTSAKGTSIPRNVSFSHIQVREYEPELDCNPSVQSGVPICLGWNYNPNEKRLSLDGQEDSLPKSKSAGNLRLSDTERARRLESNPNISFDDMTRVLREVEKTKIERRHTLTLYRRERRQASEAAKAAG